MTLIYLLHTHDVHVEATRVIAVENVYERVSSFFSVRNKSCDRLTN